MLRLGLLKALTSRIVAIRCDHPVRVAIDGVDAAGKTTLADELIEPIRAHGRPVIRASIDGFHNPRAVRYQRGASSATGYYQDSFNYEALKATLLDPLGPNGSRKIRVAAFDFRADSEVLPPLRMASECAVLLFDGVFLQRPELSGLWEMVIWVGADFNVTVPRALARAGRQDNLRPEELRALQRQYQERYVPGQKLYIKECRPHERAHIVVRNDDFQNPELETLHPDPYSADDQ